eukprot:GHVU01192426.1.p2 GENE.GHVU01192426.1~~GHVU01192426.1.p2  ORF type:complete len:174 (-),score=5.82 GHVU01192426.1:199-720(-)
MWCEGPERGAIRGAGACDERRSTSRDMHSKRMSARKSIQQRKAPHVDEHCGRWATMKEMAAIGCEPTIYIRIMWVGRSVGGQQYVGRVGRVVPDDQHTRAAPTPLERRFTFSARHSFNHLLPPYSHSLKDLPCPPTNACLRPSASTAHRHPWSYGRTDRFVHIGKSNYMQSIR